MRLRGPCVQLVWTIDRALALTSTASTGCVRLERLTPGEVGAAERPKEIRQRLLRVCQGAGSGFCCGLLRLGGMLARWARAIRRSGDPGICREPSPAVANPGRARVQLPTRFSYAGHLRGNSVHYALTERCESVQHA